MARIYVHDEFPPETSAMLQALYSRSAESVETHAQRINKDGASNFMRSYYVGYGHASIGDCGFTTIYFEDVSIIAAKAIQDNPMYSGQECSTRYLDFAHQPFGDPVGTTDSAAILAAWRNFYIEGKPLVAAYLKECHPLQEDQDPSTWEKAITARAFDILRGFLPAGAQTQLSWSTNFRQAFEKLKLLKFHPLEEVRTLATEALTLLKDRYPASFSHREYPEETAYLKEIAFKLHYLSPEDNEVLRDFSYTTTIDNASLEKAEEYAISSRPRSADLPRYLKSYGTYKCRFPLDYGSFRDIQRHRNGLCRIPLLDGSQGFNQWYLDHLPEEMRPAAENLLKAQLERIKGLQKAAGCGAEDLQYYFPLGTNVASEVVYDLPQMVYVAELRSKKTVHPTLRRVAQQMQRALAVEHPKLALYGDLSEDDWDIRRGTQDIVRKG